MNAAIQPPRRGGVGARAGFSLLEVMIAIGIFFMVAFSVLALVSQCLRQAAALEQVRTPMGSLAAQVFATNHLEEGYDTGDFDDLFPGYRWTREVVLVTNGFYEVYLTVSHDRQRKPESELLLQRYQPDAGTGRMPGRPVR